MNLKHIRNSILIFVFRLLDLYTTHIATPNAFANQEQNFLVKNIGLSKIAFFIEEVIFAFLLIVMYLISIRKNDVFKIKANTFSSYLKMFFFNKKDNKNVLKYLCSFSFKKAFYLYGTIIPQLYIATSIILALNNYWVYLLIKGIKPAVSSYRFFDKMYGIDFIIFNLPVILFFAFMYHKLKKEYRKNNV